MANKTKTHQEFLENSEVLMEAVFKVMELVDKNQGKLGVLVKEKRWVEGKEKLTPEGDPVITADGQVDKYPDSYYLELANTTTGTFSIKVDKEVFDSVDVNERYLLTYALDVKQIVSKSKSGFEYVQNVIGIKPLHFEKIKNLRVAS